MPRHLQATPSGEGLRIGVALARFNQSVTDLLLAGALAAISASMRSRCAATPSTRSRAKASISGSASKCDQKRATPGSPSPATSSW